MIELSVDADRSLTGWYRQSTPKVRRVFWTCAVAWGLDSMDGFVFQYLIPAIVAGLGITLAQAGSIASANYFAGAIGGWTGGWLADRYGRARVLQVTILWFSIFSFLSGFAQDYTQLLVLRTGRAGFLERFHHRLHFRCHLLLSGFLRGDGAGEQQDKGDRCKGMLTGHGGSPG